MAEGNTLNNSDILSQIKLSKDASEGTVKTNLEASRDQIQYLSSIDSTLKQIAGGASQSSARRKVFGNNGVFGEDYDDTFGKRANKAGRDDDSSYSNGSKPSGFSLSSLTRNLDLSPSGIANAIISGSSTGFSGLLDKFKGAFIESFDPMNLMLTAITASLSLIEPLLESISKRFQTWLRVWNRREEDFDKFLENAQKRFESDVRSWVQAPFDILKAAAQDFYTVWDENLRTINATQGYTKSDLQDLFAAYSERLRQEGLTNVIASTDITQQLARVLESGLSGRIAEEFAYQATKLGAAIPTQDFFGYAATYSSIAANAVKAGKSQSQAIQLATDSLYEFANNVLYASRELSGGFTTGLKDAQSLYEQAVKITQAAGVGDVAKVSGVFTAVAGIVGATAPDLANSITDTIYKAATGGNASDIVALRSLAGINASNTEFLRALARDPQGVFSAMFKNLAAMYTSSGDAFMEKAEAYASLFGLSSEAFQRIDFNYLARAISDMDVNSGSLEQNLEMLRSGQTTQTQEQLKIAKINQYAIEEGLSYVLDNQVARSIQEHMWDKELQDEYQKTTWSVELTGNALDLLTSLYEMSTASAMISHASYSSAEALAGAASLGIDQSAAMQSTLAIATDVFHIQEQTRDENEAIQQDIVSLLEELNVGTSNQTSLMRLITHDVSGISNAQTINELVGIQSQYAGISNVFNQRVSDYFRNYDDASGGYLLAGGVDALARAELQSIHGSAPISTYSWRSVGKSLQANAAMLLSAESNNLTDSLVRQMPRMSNSSKAQSQVKSIVDDMLSKEYLEEFFKSGKVFEEWKTSSSNKIADFSEALSASGYSEDQIRAYYNYSQALYESGVKQKQVQNEQDFYSEVRDFVNIRFWDEFNAPLKEHFQDPLLVLLEDNFDAVRNWQEAFSSYFQEKFAKAWESHWKEYSDYYIKHQIYDGGTIGLKTLEAVQKSEKESRGDLANALSEYLTSNNWNLNDLKDPQIQANMLLSQILVVLNAIMNQNNQSAGSLSLLDSLSGLALGGTYTSTLGSGKTL